MHALPSHPKHPVLFGLLVLILALVLMAASAPELGTLDFSVGGGGEASAPSAAPAPVSPPIDATPAWATDPLAPPVEQLRR
jgi:hypothetical protein